MSVKRPVSWLFARNKGSQVRCTIKKSLTNEITSLRSVSPKGPSPSVCVPAIPAFRCDPPAESAAWRKPGDALVPILLAGSPPPTGSAAWRKSLRSHPKGLPHARLLHHLPLNRSGMQKEIVVARKLGKGGSRRERPPNLHFQANSRRSGSHRARTA